MLHAPVCCRAHSLGDANSLPGGVAQSGLYELDAFAPNEGIVRVGALIAPAADVFDPTPTHGDYELRIAGFSQLTAFAPVDGTDQYVFKVQLYAGSCYDGDIGYDLVPNGVRGACAQCI